MLQILLGHLFHRKIKKLIQTALEVSVRLKYYISDQSVWMYVRRTLSALHIGEAKDEAEEFSRNLPRFVNQCLCGIKRPGRV
jgi:hypothetical protein